MTMISNPNASKSQYSNNANNNVVPNLKRPTQVYNNDDTDELAANKSKIH